MLKGKRRRFTLRVAFSRQPWSTCRCQHKAVTAKLPQEEARSFLSSCTAQEWAPAAPQWLELADRPTALNTVPFPHLPCQRSLQNKVAEILCGRAACVPMALSGLMTLAAP